MPDHEIDRPMADELFEEIRNDGTLYRQRIEPIIRNFKRKMNRGIYDRAKAVVGLRHVVDDYIRKKAREDRFDSRLVNAETRNKVATEVRDWIETTIREEDVNSDRLTAARALGTG